MGEGNQEEAAAPPSWVDGVDESSPSMTVVPFNPPPPLLRGPVSVDPTDDLSSGPFVLAFPNKASWTAAYGAAQAKIKAQCEVAQYLPPANANHGGEASFNLNGQIRVLEKSARREMAACIALAKEACIKFSKG